MPVREEESWSTPKPQKATGIRQNHATEQDLMYEGCSQSASKDVGQMKQVLVYGMCECGESVEREVTT